MLFCCLTLLHSEQPKLHRGLAVLSAIGLKGEGWVVGWKKQRSQNLRRNKFSKVNHDPQQY